MTKRLFRKNYRYLEYAIERWYLSRKKHYIVYDPGGHWVNDVDSLDAAKRVVRAEVRLRMRLDRNGGPGRL